MSAEPPVVQYCHFLRCTSTDERGVDEIDRMHDTQDHHSPSRRSDGDLDGILDLLDELQVGKEES